MKEEKIRLLRGEAKCNLEKTISEANRLLNTLSDESKSEVRSWLLVASQWLELNPFASKDELEKRFQIEYLVCQKTKLPD